MDENCTYDTLSEFQGDTCETSDHCPCFYSDRNQCCRCKLSLSQEEMANIQRFVEAVQKIKMPDFSGMN